MNKKLKRFSKMQMAFLFLFVVLNLYYLVIKSELYESRTALLVKDMSSSAPNASLGLSLLGMGTSSQVQDSKVVEEYLMSLDIYKRLNEKFGINV